MNRLTLGEKKEILDFRIRNPEKSYKKMADYFSIKLGNIRPVAVKSIFAKKALFGGVLL